MLPLKVEHRLNCGEDLHMKKNKKRSKPIECIACPQQGEEVEHPISMAISNFLNKSNAIVQLAKLYIPAAIKHTTSNIFRVKKDLNEIRDILSKNKNKTMPSIISRTEKVVRQFENIRSSELHSVLESSLFIGLFSYFDVFMGDFLVALYDRKPELYSKLNHQFTVSQLLQYKSFDEVKKAALNEDIDSFKRKSYVEQFEDLEKMHGITLTKFDKWPNFVECTQRRNLFAHCNGIVSQQYLNICKKYGYNHKEPVRVNDKLNFKPLYSLEVCNLLSEVVFKLGHTLWRKVLPNEISEADKWMNRIVYSFLLQEDWKMSQIYGEFAVGLRDFSTDIDRRISVINYAIALKFGGKKNEALEILSKEDWSSVSYDFKIAHAVLHDKYIEASTLMKQMGKKGTIIEEEVYHIWPLFKEFRMTKEFLNTYQKIYKRSFMIELERVASKENRRSQSQLPHEIASQQN
jgi:hypothetical protein